MQGPAFRPPSGSGQSERNRNEPQAAKGRCAAGGTPKGAATFPTKDEVEAADRASREGQRQTQAGRPHLHRALFSRPEPSEARRCLAVAEEVKSAISENPVLPDKPERPEIVLSVIESAHDLVTKPLIPRDHAPTGTYGNGDGRTDNDTQRLRARRDHEQT